MLNVHPPTPAKAQVSVLSAVEYTPNGKPIRASALRACTVIRQSVGLLASGDKPDDDNDDYDRDDDEMDTGPPLSKTKRANVKKAVKVNEGDDEDDGDGEGGDDEKPEDKQKASNFLNKQRKQILELWSDFIEKPGELRPVDPVLLKSWKMAVPKRLKVKKMKKKVPKKMNTAKVTCPLPGCKSSFVSALGMSMHYQRCGQMLSYVCKLCNFVCEKSHRGLIEHMLSSHGVCTGKVVRFLF